MSGERHPIHVLVPMSGQGTRYRAAAYQEPKPLIPVSGKAMIARLLESFPESWPCHFVMAENHKGTELPGFLSRSHPRATQTFIPVHTEGPGMALLAGLAQIPAEASVLVSYCDYGLVWDARRFEDFVQSSACDACLVSYRGFHAHYLSPVKYAYSRLQGERVVEVREKGSFSSERENEYASCGAYYFRSAALLRKALEYQIKSELRLNGELYTSLTIEALLRMDPKAYVRVFEIPAFFQWGTPEDLQDYEYWEQSFRAKNKAARRRAKVAQVLMPMAGHGSRFKEISSLPKPLIPIGGLPMYAAALESLPLADKNVLVARDDFSARLAKTYEVISLSATPPGQALSTQQGLKGLDLQKEVIVSACDHEIVMSAELWQDFQQTSAADAGIFTIKGFPGARRNPTAYAYVEVDKSSDKFPMVRSVSVKKPLSQRPTQDPLLVGTFWFRTAKILDEALGELVKRNLRVNGELYLDSVFGILIEKGLSVRQIPLEGYIGWGEPDALAEALYWQEIFCGRQLCVRPRYPGVTNGT